MSGGDPGEPPVSARSALSRVTGLLRCPVCTGDLREVAGGVRCDSGHAFDRARQGHLTLFGPAGRRFRGDTPEQVASRERVFAGGAFDPVVRAVAAEVATAAGSGAPVVVEAGAGTGVYLSAALDLLRSAGGQPRGIGTEISAPAARRLARADPDAAALVADTWDGLPLVDGCADVVSVVFAPRNVEEFARVLRPGGALVVAVPAPGHLEPLCTRVGMLEPAVDKVDRLVAGFGRHFHTDPGHDWPLRVRAEIVVPAALACDVVLMGPSGVHLGRSEVEATLEGRDQCLRLCVDVYRVRRGHAEGDGGQLSSEA